MIRGREIPRLILVTVSDGQYTAVLRPDQLADWIVAHLGAGQQLWTWNAKFDWAVVRQFLVQSVGPAEAAGQDDLSKARKNAYYLWDELPGNNRLRDGMLLDFLVRLADPHQPPGLLHTRGLKDAALDLLGVRITKDQEVRTGFGAMADPASWSDPKNREALDYAARDAWVTFKVYQELSRRAAQVKRDHMIPTNLGVAHGPLTECLQVRADIALDEAGRRGMAVDPEKVREVKARLEGRRAAEVAWIDQNAPAVLGRDTVKKRLGQLIINPRTGVPKISTKGLLDQLGRVVEEAEVDPADIPLTPKGKTWTTSAGWWQEAAGDHPFVRHWAGLQDTAKLLQFVAQLDGKDAVQSDYHVLVRTGRTSCRAPNIQQMPKAGGFRDLFVARPGHKFIIADYAAIELVTLAAVLESRWPGQSTLARVLREGRKPHDYTAALVMGVPYEEFLALKKTDPDLHKARRQAAKAINFGVPGGLGARKLALYARANYGVDMTEEEAKALRAKLIHEVYPELSLYLADSWESLSRALRCPVGTLKREWAARNNQTAEEQEASIRVTGLSSMAGIPGVVRGLGKRDGTSYNPHFERKVWGFLRACNNSRDPFITDSLRAEQGGLALHTALFAETVTTLTGRVRAGVRYTEARNTPFQGLAADGAKAALWELRQYTRYGWHCAAFVHDEIVMEVPDYDAETAFQEVPTAMSWAMRTVLACGLPVEVEAVVADRWAK